MNHRKELLWFVHSSEATRAWELLKNPSCVLSAGQGTSAHAFHTRLVDTFANKVCVEVFHVQEQPCLEVRRRVPWLRPEPQQLWPLARRLWLSSVPRPSPQAPAWPPRAVKPCAVAVRFEVDRQD
ncbi:hypothetical protein AK812_SmicGene14012 [Symbiodinium microadriaticum]|uniref:Uncharacterized protein n=1 Tax=Symbiodinium microadriaticum TaxID=2951 RepID=A0A1Q9E6P2_SYMMI|nr:hypothetical protein AK812_SmicGene14012 [Symbiodinium microadriaticum]